MLQSDVTTVYKQDITRFVEVSDYLKANGVPPIPKAKVKTESCYQITDLEPPEMLHFRSCCKGPEILNGFLSVGISGSASENSDRHGLGRKFSKCISASTIRYGLVRRVDVSVVAGCAFVIDEAAHLGALDEGGESTAVIPRSVKRGVYPHPDHVVIKKWLQLCAQRKAHRLEEKLLDQGCLVSETNSKRKPKMPLILARDRIITALSDFVVIVECKKNGGTVDTGLRALLQGIPVFVVDWNKVEGFTSRRVFTTGNNQLLKLSPLPGRPQPKPFPEDSVLDLCNADRFDKCWHTFIDRLLKSFPRISCRSKRFT